MTLPSGPTQFVADLRGFVEIQDDLFDAFGPEVRPAGPTTLTYEGYLGINDVTISSTFDAYLGQASATFNPAASSLNGSATSFHSSVVTTSTGGGQTISDGTPVSGTVTFSGTGFTGDDTIDTTFSGTVDGQTVVGNGDAAFYGTNGTFLEIITFNGTLDGDPVDIYVAAD